MLGQHATHSVSGNIMGVPRWSPRAGRFLHCTDDGQPKELWGPLVHPASSLCWVQATASPDPWAQQLALPLPPGVRCGEQATQSLCL